MTEQTVQCRGVRFWLENLFSRLIQFVSYCFILAYNLLEKLWRKHTNK